MPIHPRIVRAEIEDILQSDRLVLYLSVSAQLFHLSDSKWVELTPEPILVHLIHDKLEGVAKMLAVWKLKLVINNVPVSSNFNIHTPSKKFLQFVCNKFDKNSDNYGFGFADVNEMDMFHQQLVRIRSAAMASLTPSFHLGSTPVSQSSRPQRRALFSRSSYGSVSSPSAPTVVSPPFGYMGSPMRSSQRTESVGSFHIDTGKDEQYTFNDQNQVQAGRHQSFPPYDATNYQDYCDEQCNAEDYAFFNRPYNESTPVTPPPQEAPIFSAVDQVSDMFPFNANPDPTMELYHATERRLMDLIAAFDIGSVPPVADTAPEVLDVSFNTDNVFLPPANQAGAIGTPVKGKGGVHNVFTNDDNNSENASEDDYSSYF